MHLVLGNPSPDQERESRRNLSCCRLGTRTTGVTQPSRKDAGMCGGDVLSSLSRSSGTAGRELDD